MAGRLIPFPGTPIPDPDWDRLAGRALDLQRQVDNLQRQQDERRAAIDRQIEAIEDLYRARQRDLDNLRTRLSDVRSQITLRRIP